MLKHARRFAYASVGLLVALLIWRAFFYEAPKPEPAMAVVAVPVATPAPQAASPTTPSDLVLDLFSPTEGMLAAQINESTLVRQIDEALTISFMLRRCELITARDYSQTYRALVTYAFNARMGATMAEAEARVRAIVETASASYALIYSRTPCDAPELATATQQLAQWRNAMLGRDHQ